MNKIGKYIVFPLILFGLITGFLIQGIGILVLGQEGYVNMATEVLEALHDLLGIRHE